MKQEFDIITSTCVPLPLENVDTDQIIPARFLKATTKEGQCEQGFRAQQPSIQGLHPRGWQELRFRFES